MCSDMIAETNDLLRRGGEVADKLRRRYTHVFVDEFQVCIRSTGKWEAVEAS